MNVASSFCITRMVISTCDALHPSADARKEGGGRHLCVLDKIPIIRKLVYNVKPFAFANSQLIFLPDPA